MGRTTHADEWMAADITDAEPGDYVRIAATYADESDIPDGHIPVESRTARPMAYPPADMAVRVVDAERPAPDDENIRFTFADTTTGERQFTAEYHDSGHPAMVKKPAGWAYDPTP